MFKLLLVASCLVALAMSAAIPEENDLAVAESANPQGLYIGFGVGPGQYGRYRGDYGSDYGYGRYSSYRNPYYGGYGGYNSGYSSGYGYRRDPYYGGYGGVGYRGYY